MKIGADGGPLKTIHMNVAVGCARSEEDGSKSLVFVDQNTGEMNFFPMRDDQMEAVYNDWSGKKLVTATQEDVKSLITK